MKNLELVKTVKTVNTVVVVKYNNSFDIFKSLETGVIQSNSKISSKPGDILVLNNTNDGTYVIGGLVTSGRGDVRTNVMWFDTTQDDYQYEHRIKSITPFRVFMKNDFETSFPNSRTIKFNKPLGISFSHKLELNNDQLEMMLA